MRASVQLVDTAYQVSRLTRRSLCISVLSSALVAKAHTDTANNAPVPRRPMQDFFEPRAPGQIVVGGHRGVGENLTSERGLVYPSYRENTIKSFQHAAELGVSFVEFDVQVTKDGVPVLWHDDDIVYGEPEQPQVCEVKDLTLSQFQELCGGQQSTASSFLFDTTSSLMDNVSLCGTVSPTPSTPSSVSSRKSRLLRAFRDKETHQPVSKLLPWSCSDEDALPTLEDVFKAVPESVGFDIEVKMTTGDDIVHTPAEEIDRMLAAILNVVSQCTSSSPNQRKRKIFFSSFDPDVCSALKRRKAPYPVYYLSGCGLYKHADERRTSIPAALEFAAKNELGGVVLPASVLIANKQMVEDAHKLDLEVMTYGLENNDLASVEEQGRMGVQAAIIDDVEAAMTTRGKADR